MRYKDLWQWILEREAARLTKEMGYTVTTSKDGNPDPIIAKYRFCNVHRENDRVTRELAPLVRSAHPDAWFNITIGRLLNNPSSVALVVRDNCKVSWNPQQFVKTLQAYRDAGNRVFNAAYIVRANLGTDKIEYLAEQVLTPLWHARKSLTTDAGATLEKSHGAFMKFIGLGPFLSAQVVADWKFCDRHLRAAEDWLTWAASGPGSKRGLNRVYGNDPGDDWREDEWLRRLQNLHQEINRLQRDSNVACISAQDLQNCLCEFDKYERARLGEGKPKQLYKPHHEGV